MAKLTEEGPETLLSRRIDRRTFLRRALMGGAGTAVALGVYGVFIEPEELVIKKVEVAVRNLAEAFHGFRIALLADLHYGPYTGEREISNAVRTVNSLKPDIVAIVGDFVSSPSFTSPEASARKIEPCSKLLMRLQSTFGNVAVLGNHDMETNPGLVADVLNGSGVPVLSNSSRPLEKDGARLWFAGVEDALEGRPDIIRALRGIPAREARVLLAHEPDFAMQASTARVDLQLSGHSHGGQVRMPFYGAIVLPPMGRLFPSGLYNVRGMHLYTNHGIGTVGLPVRFDCPPEVTLITLRPA